MESDAIETLFSLKTQAAVKSIGAGYEVLQNVSLTTYVLLFLPIIVIIGANAVLINQDQSVTSTDILAVMIVDVVVLLLFLYGFYSLLIEVGRYSVFHTKLK